MKATSLQPLRDVDTGPTEVVLPTDTVVGEPEVLTVASARQGIEGLLAVGVPLGEALRAYAKELPVEAVVSLACDLERSGLERMQALFEAQLDIPDKAGFGQACLKAGFHPAGVALVAAGELSEGSTGIARLLIRNFGVDTWLAEKFNFMGELVLDSEDVLRVSAPEVFLPCDLRVLGKGPLVVDWLKEAGGRLALVSSQGFGFPSLTRVGSKLDASDSRGASFPALEHAVGSVVVSGSRNLDMPNLRVVEGAFELYDDRVHSLHFPKLEKIEGMLRAKRSSGLSLPSLKSAGSMELSGAKDIDLPALMVVVGTMSVQCCRDMSFPALGVVGGMLATQDSSNLAFPALLIAEDSLLANGSKNLNFPVLTRVGHKLALTDNSASTFPALSEVAVVEVNGAKGVVFPSLEKINGSLFAGKCMELQVPLLERVDGEMLVEQGGNIGSYILTKVGAKLDAGWRGPSFPVLKEVAGNMRMCVDASVPSLRMVTGKPWGVGDGVEPWP